MFAASLGIHQEGKPIMTQLNKQHQAPLVCSQCKHFRSFRDQRYGYCKVKPTIYEDMRWLRPEVKASDNACPLVAVNCPF